MRGIHGRSLALGLAALGIVVLAACDAGVRLGEVCERSSQCAAPLACVLGRCRSECVEARDCPLESECVPVGAASVCRLPSDVCEEDGDCAAPLLCGADGVCRASCTGDEQCPSGSACVLSDGRLLCVRDELAPRDAGTDAARGDAGQDASIAQSCGADVNPFFENGLSGWCIETSSGVGPDRVRALAAGSADGVAEIDLTEAEAGEWVRLYQDLPLDERDGHSFYFPEIAIPEGGGAVVVALEAVDAAGSVLGRTAVHQGSGVSSPCAATGRSAGDCRAGGGPDMAVDPRGLWPDRVDLRQVVVLRRVVEVIAGPAESARVVLDGVGRNLPYCPISWWRVETADVLDERLDRPVSGLAPGLSWSGPVVPYPAPACGSAVLFDGATALDVPRSAAPLELATDAFTIELHWHAPIGAGFPLAGDRVMLEQIDGDLSIAVRGNRITARMGRCGAGAPALEVVDPTPLGPTDQRIQELEVVADWPGGRLCLAREGRPIACDVVPDCTLGAPGPGGLRIGGGKGDGWRGGLDELRIRSGDHGPGSGARTGRCYVDDVCLDAGLMRARDVGSNECLDAAECTEGIASCRDHARDPGLSCAGAGAVACSLAPSCVDGTAECGGPCSRGIACADELSCP